MNQKYFLCLCHFPHFCSLWGCLFVCFFPLRMSNSHWAAHWRSCVSSVRLIWPLSQSSFSLWLQEQKIYCRGIWPEDNFILREGQRVMGRRKKERKKTTTKENQKTTPSKQKKKVYRMPTEGASGACKLLVVHSEHHLLLTQWGTTKDKWTQHTSPANVNNSECRAGSSLAVGERWELSLKQQPRSSVKQG